jgi:signal transduction histidine kinase
VLRSGLEEIDRLTTMCEDLLLITRADARLLRLHRTPTNVGALIDRSLDSLHRRIEEKDISIGRAARGGDGVSVDPELVLRVVDHLLENAVTHTPPGGRIEVGVEEAGSGGVKLTVANSGSPIAAEDLPHLFEPFYRADTSRTRGNDAGTGLGLAMVAAIAQLHDGTARVSAEPAGGARFEVELGGSHA